MNTIIKEVNKKKTNSFVTSLKYPSIKVAEVKPIYKRKRALRVPHENFVVRSQWDAYGIFKQIWNMNVIDYCEEVYAIFLNGGHSFHAYAHIGEGSINQCQVHIQKVLTLALITNSAGFIIAHNHPSGTLEVSDADKLITQRIYKAAKLVGLKLLDHLIVTSDSDRMRSINCDFPELF